jgi:hypothetical protein
MKFLLCIINEKYDNINNNSKVQQFQTRLGTLKQKENLRFFVAWIKILSQVQKCPLVGLVVWFYGKPKRHQK